MTNLINWQLLKEQSIYEQLKEKISNQKIFDESEISSNFNPIEADGLLVHLEYNYNFIYQKLDFISKLNELTDDKKQKVVQVIAKIDCLDNIVDEQKIKMILSYGVLVDYFNRINERTEEELFMLSACSCALDLEDYIYYVGILSNEQISQAITSKSSELSEQVNIAYAIMNSQDELPYDCITSENYYELVSNGLNIVNNYSINPIK